MKVLSSEIHRVIEADVLYKTEGSMKDDDMVSHQSLYRSPSPWHDMRWSLRKLGRSSVFLRKYARTSQRRRELADDTEEVGLIDSTWSIGKLCTWGSGQQWKAWISTSHNNTLRL